MRYFEQPPALKTPPYWLAVNFEVTSACNLKCAGCARTLEIDKHNWTSRHMTMAQFTKLVEHVPPTRTAVMQGIGEPTLNPHFLDFLRLARESGKFYELLFFTNALVRDVDYYAEASKYVDHFIISIDTLNPHFVEATCAGTDTEKLKDMVARLLARGLKFEISMVVSTFNAADVPSTLKILNDIGPLLVRFQLFESAPEDRPEGVLTRTEYVLLQEAVEKFRPFLPNITPIFAPLPDATVNNQFFCGVGAPALAPFISSRGYLTPCCRILDPEVWDKASLVENTFQEIWESQTVRDYVHRFMEKGDKACAGCYQNRRDPLSEEEAADFFQATERILVPAVNFAMRLQQPEEARSLALSFFDSVRRAQGDPMNKAQALYKISTIFHQLGHARDAHAAADAVTALIGANPQIDQLRAVLGPVAEPV